MFDLPAQRIAFASFEISFRMPIEQRSLFEEKSLEMETLERVGELLRKGLAWLTSRQATEFEPANQDEFAVVLRALRALTPSSQGSIEQLELGGQLVGRNQSAARDNKWILGRAERSRVNEAIKSGRFEPQVIDLEGYVRELDIDRLSFELREIDGQVLSQRFVFAEDLLEDVYQVLGADVRVQVAGSKSPGTTVANALALSRVRSTG
jgi:hypothetical protein